MAHKIGKDRLNRFVEDLRSTHKDNLASVILYGSVAAGDQIASQSDYNLLIALHRIRPQDLKLAQAPTRKWQRLGHPLPVYFTVAELRDAADVFPIEFHQMEKARALLYGQDPFEALPISDENLRHQTEYELRSKLIQLRRLYIPASGSVKKLCTLMTDSLTSFATLFAPVLMLSGVEPPVTKRECVKATARYLGLNEGPFERVFELRAADGVRPMTEAQADDLFAAYLAQIERVIDAANHLPVDTSRDRR